MILMSAVTAYFSRLSPRERVMVGGLGATIAVFVLGLAVLQVSSSLDELESQNFEDAEALRLIGRNADKLRESQREQAAQERKFARKAPALQGWLEQIATKRSLEIPEAQDKPDVNRGKNFIERSVEIRLRKIGLAPLTEFMVDVENSPSPVAITRLHVRRRMGESDSYDVEMTVSAYDSLGAAKTDKGPRSPLPRAALEAGRPTPAAGSGSED
ncbi:MAG: type II secretion system protein M [Deltaproteobacteria bacterium]|nr:type II secretion system protein M [Deltaproteobacteria bacterium]